MVVCGFTTHGIMVPTGGHCGPAYISSLLRSYNGLQHVLRATAVLLRELDAASGALVESQVAGTETTRERLQNFAGDVRWAMMEIERRIMAACINRDDAQH